MKTWQHRVLQWPTLVPFAVTSGWSEGYRIRPRYKESHLRGHTIFIFLNSSHLLDLLLDLTFVISQREDITFEPLLDSLD